MKKYFVGKINVCYFTLKIIWQFWRNILSRNKSSSSRNTLRESWMWTTRLLCGCFSTEIQTSVWHSQIEFGKQNLHVDQETNMKQKYFEGKLNVCHFTVKVEAFQHPVTCATSSNREPLIWEYFSNHESRKGKVSEVRLTPFTILQPIID